MGGLQKRREGFKMNSYDNVTDENIMIVSGIVDFFSQTMKFKVSPLK